MACEDYVCSRRFTAKTRQDDPETTEGRNSAFTSIRLLGVPTLTSTHYACWTLQINTDTRTQPELTGATAC